MRTQTAGLCFKQAVCEPKFVAFPWEKDKPDFPNGWKQSLQAKGLPENAVQMLSYQKLCFHW